MNMTINASKLFITTRRPMIAGAVILILLGSLIAGNVWAADPRFNFESTDLKTLTVFNRTQNSGWQNVSVTAGNNNQVAFQVYYRNGVADSIARNTKVRLSFPNITQNSITVNVTLSADNAPTVTDSAVVYSSSPQKLTFETNNIRWYPDRAATPTIISAAASGAGFIEASLGDIGPCWEHQGYVVFYASLAPEVTYNFSLNKMVRNVSLNQSGFYESTNASSGDTVEFELKVPNTGGGALTNLIFSDTLPPYLSYVPGSTRLNGAPASDGIAGASGLNIGSVGAGATATITFQATISSCSNQTLTNYGYARADQVAQKSDTAAIVIVARTCAVGNPLFRPTP